MRGLLPRSLPSPIAYSLDLSAGSVCLLLWGELRRLSPGQIWLLWEVFCWRLRTSGRRRLWSHRYRGRQHCILVLPPVLSWGVPSPNPGRCRLRHEHQHGLLLYCHPPSSFLCKKAAHIPACHSCLPFYLYHLSPLLLVFFLFVQPYIHYALKLQAQVQR